MASGVPAADLGRRVARDAVAEAPRVVPFYGPQAKLGTSDLLNEYITHIGGGVWACPPGVRKPGDWFGKALFEG